MWEKIVQQSTLVFSAAIKESSKTEVSIMAEKKSAVKWPRRDGLIF